MYIYMNCRICSQDDTGAHGRALARPGPGPGALGRLSRRYPPGTQPQAEETKQAHGGAGPGWRRARPHPHPLPPSSSLCGPAGRRRADSAPGAIISTVASFAAAGLTVSRRRARNYFPVIALAPGPPHTIDRPPPLPPGPGRSSMGCWGHRDGHACLVIVSRGPAT